MMGIPCCARPSNFPSWRSGHSLARVMNVPSWRSVPRVAESHQKCSSSSNAVQLCPAFVSLLGLLARRCQSMAPSLSSSLDSRNFEAGKNDMQHIVGSRIIPRNPRSQAWATRTKPSTTQEQTFRPETLMRTSSNFKLQPAFLTAAASKSACMLVQPTAYLTHGHLYISLTNSAPSEIKPPYLKLSFGLGGVEFPTRQLEPGIPWISHSWESEFHSEFPKNSQVVKSILVPNSKTTKRKPAILVF